MSDDYSLKKVQPLADHLQSNKIFYDLMEAKGIILQRIILIDYFFNHLLA